MPAVFGLEALDPRVLLAGDILATLIHDVNGNGVRDAEEPELAGWQVYVDLNQNGSPDDGEPQGLTDADGEVLFEGLPAGTYDVVEVLPVGWAASPGFSEKVPVLVRNGEKEEVRFLNMTSANGSIEGTVWYDLNGDGVQAPTDPGLPGWTVFIDADNNGSLDAGEPSIITDAGGNFRFASVEPGLHRVREIVPAGWDTTIGYDSNAEVSVEPVTTSYIDFGNFNPANLGSIGGTVWNDVNGDGIRGAGDPGLADWTVFIDLNGNATFDMDLNGDGIANDPEPSALTDALGVYSFPSIAAGTYTVIEVLQAGWNVSPGYPATRSVSVTGQAKSTVDFANYTPALGTISGTVWNDLDGNGLRSGEPGLEGWTVFIDQDGDGAPSAGEPADVTDASGSYTLVNIPIGAQVVRELTPIGWRPTAPGTGMQLVSMLNGTDITGINFGNKQRTDSSISGRAFTDSNKNGVRDAGEAGLPGITVWLDLDNNGTLDADEPSMVTMADQFYTPAVDEAGAYEFTHLAGGDYVVREVLPVTLSATLAEDRMHAITLLPGEDRANVDFANRYRPSEIHGVKFDDRDGDHVRDDNEPGMEGVTIYLDLDRDDILDEGEPSVITGPDGSYSLEDLEDGAYVVREIEPEDHSTTYPTTTGGILWPPGVSNPAVGDVTPTSITASMADGESLHQTVSITLPGSGALTNLVDVFLLFDDTGSFTSNSPIVRAAFPLIITALQASLPGIDLAFGVGRLEEYANFASEYGTGRPFILNQPMAAASTPGFTAAIQAALDRMAPGYGGDTPETDIEALYQLVTGLGFDGNNNGSVMDSGAAGLVSTQLHPGTSGDVPPFSSYVADASGHMLPAAGTLGGAGFRAGALPIVLLATDTGFAYQPMGETSITGVGGLTLPLSALTQASRPSTPFNSGAGIQETITALNALGALVIGLGTNPQATADPRQFLEAIANLTGAINRSTTTIANGTADAVAPGDPFYFQIASGFGTSVANGIVTAIENAATNVAVNITLKASDPRVHIISTPSVVPNVGAGQTATFDVEFVGDDIPHRFDLLFVREGTNVVLGSIPVVLGTPIPGDGYEFEDLEEGEIEYSSDFGSHLLLPASIVGGLPTAVTTTMFPVSWSALGGSGVMAYDVYVSDDDGPFTLWLADTPATSAPFAGESFHTYAFYSVAKDGVGPAELAPVAADATTFVAAVDGTSDDDDLLLRVDPADPARLQILRSGTPAYSVDLSLLPKLGLDGLAGTNRIVLDFTHGDFMPVEGILINGIQGIDRIEIIGETPGSMIDVSNAAITLGPSTIGLAGIERIALSIAAAGKTLTVSGGIVDLDAQQPLAGMSVTSTGRIELAAASGQILRTQSLWIDGDGTLDLFNQAMIIGSGVLADVTAWLASGRTANAATRWQGTGIVSSAAALPANSSHTLAVLLNDDASGDAIHPDVPLGSILVKHTWNGDANLDGRVGGADYLRLDLSFLSSGLRYQDGDFDYSGEIDGDDYYLIDQGYLVQTAVLGPVQPRAAVIGKSSRVFSDAKPVESAEPLWSDFNLVDSSGWPWPGTLQSPSAQLRLYALPDDEALENLLR